MNKGELLLEFDQEKIKAEGYDTTTSLIITEPVEGSRFEKEADKPTVKDVVIPAARWSMFQKIKNNGSWIMKFFRKKILAICGSARICLNWMERKFFPIVRRGSMRNRNGFRICISLAIRF